MKYLAQVRKDIREREEGVPVGDLYIYDGKLYEYRCPTEDTLEIWFEGQWREAVNIDWDFIEVYEYRPKSFLTKPEIDYTRVQDYPSYIGV